MLLIRMHRRLRSRTFWVNVSCKAVAHSAIFSNTATKDGGSTTYYVEGDRNRHCCTLYFVVLNDQYIIQTMKLRQTNIRFRTFSWMIMMYRMAFLLVSCIIPSLGKHTAPCRIVIEMASRQYASINVPSVT
jgi:hypothetical protein